MMQPIEFILLNLLFLITTCYGIDDGKYRPEKYAMYDDGKYYRPLDEGKYIPGDEGKYTYVYVNSLYPALPYIHQLGPDGGNGGFGGEGGYGGEGGFGPNGPSGPNGPNGPDEQNKANRIQYIGRRIYAERYPYIHKVIKALIEKYVSTDYFYGETSQETSNHYSKIYADKESAVKCQYFTPGDQDNQLKQDTGNSDNVNNFVTQYPPRMNVADGEKLGSYYSFKGTKVLSSVNNALKSKLKLEYEVFVRVVDEVSE
ncbi:hypothetical protein evm_009739 [Chilo suppressalis]|nr:hypothetical protein evm_009739 [Chilo suppressalis]